MNWRLAKHPVYLIGYEEGKPNGYTILRTSANYVIEYIGCYRGKSFCSDASLNIVKKACESHLQMRTAEAAGKAVVPELRSGTGEAVGTA